MQWRFWQCLVLMMAGWMTHVPANADTATRQETRAGKHVLVLENEHARLAVLPDPGGTVIEYLDKKSNTDYVAGGDRVLAGRLGFGWKDYHWLEAVEQMGRGVFTLPYEAKFTQGPGYRGIHVSCVAEGRRFEREMRLSDSSAELTTLLRVTNISDKPLRVQVRWHTYSTLDDMNAENSCIIAPGPNGEARKAFIGSGWDHQFIAADPYWMAVNYKDGSGLWMTFNREHNGMQITWTDYNHNRPGPHRGMFVAEPHPQAILAQPGESAVYDATFYPFTAADTARTMPMGMLKDAALQARARRFLADTLPNLAAIGPYTMTFGAPPAGVKKLDVPGADNRFDFIHRRRDRFALRSWGILDAMMAVPGIQEKTIRARYYARLFDSVDKPVNVSFRLRIINTADEVAREQVKPATLSPGQGREIDLRDDISMAGLPDGWYRFVLDGFVEGEKQPIHTYVESLRLVGQAREQADAQLKAFEEGPLQVRPFVQALYEKTWTTPTPGSSGNPGQASIPIGVEEGGGVARTNWPVRLGVPFAQGIISKDARFEMIAPDGRKVDVTTSPMATWMDGSVKWLQVDFNADVPANAHVFYTLRTTATKAAPRDLLAYDTADGPAIRGLDFKLGDNRIFGLLRPQDLWWEDGQGERFLFQLKGENAGVIIEQNGPDRAVIKATGWYLNPQGKHVAMGELRLEAFRGQKFVKLYHTVTFTGDPWRQDLGSYGLRFTLPTSTFTQAAVAVDGKAITGSNLSVYQRNADNVQALVDGKAIPGVRSNGAIRLQGQGGRSLGVAHLDFWQMAPKQIDFDPQAGTLTYAYWPAKAGAMSFLPREDGWIPNSSDSRAIAVGTGRTHEFVIELDGPTAPNEFDNVYAEPVIAITPPRYLAQTQAMMHLSPFDPQRYLKLEKYAALVMNFYIQQQAFYGWYGQWNYGALPNWFTISEHTWKNFGRYAWILNEQDIVETPWLCYLRTGDRRYFKFAIANTRHLMEVGTIRWNPVWPTSVGLSRRHHECIWLGEGDTGHSMLDPFLDYYYATGYRPAWEASVRMADGMTLVTSGAWRYLSNPIAGLSRMYQDTQNPVYKQHADRLWQSHAYPDKNTWWLLDHGGRMAMWYAPLNPQCQELWAQWTLRSEPELKNRLHFADTLTRRFLDTGDLKYAQAANKLVPERRVLSLTQHTLSELRAALYAGESIAHTQAATAKAP